MHRLLLTDSSEAESSRERHAAARAFDVPLVPRASGKWPLKVVDLARARVEVVTLTLIHPRRSRAPLPPHCWPPALPELACGPLHLQLSARGAAPIRRRPRRTPEFAVVTEQPHPPSSLGARQIWAILDGGPGNLGSRSARAVIRSIKGVIRSIKGVWRRRRGRRRGRRGRRGESGVAGGDGCARAVDVTT